MKGARSMLLFGVVCLALVPLISCEQKPVISRISEEQIKGIGEEVEFNCTAQYAQDFPVLWFKYDKNRRQSPVPLSSDKALIIRDKRFSLKFDQATTTYSLKIKDLREADTGFYECQILVDLTDKVSSEVELQIRRPPAIYLNATSSANVTEGEPIELRCDADGFPVPSISWKREHGILLPTGGAIYRGNVLRIPKAHRDDRGIYNCIADNGVGEQAQAAAKVRVEFAPVISSIRPRVGQAQGYDATLECRIEAHPAPKVTWLRNGAELRNEQLTEESEERIEDAVYVDALRRESVAESDYGIYTCRAQNKHGVIETRVELIESIIPVCGGFCG